MVDWCKRGDKVVPGSPVKPRVPQTGKDVTTVISQQLEVDYAGWGVCGIHTVGWDRGGGSALSRESDAKIDQGGEDEEGELHVECSVGNKRFSEFENGPKHDGIRRGEN